MKRAIGMTMVAAVVSFASVAEAKKLTLSGEAKATGTRRSR